MRRVSFLAIVGFTSAVVTIIATDYANAWGNFILTYAAARDFLGQYFVGAIGVVSFICGVAFMLFLPRAAKAAIFQIGTRGADVFLNRDSNRYQRIFLRQARHAVSIDVIGIGNSQFSEKEWLKAIDYAVGRNRTRVRVLFLAPGGNRVACREQDEGHDLGWLSNQVRAHVRFF